MFRTNDLRIKCLTPAHSHGSFLSQQDMAGKSQFSLEAERTNKNIAAYLVRIKLAFLFVVVVVAAAVVVAVVVVH